MRIGALAIACVGSLAASCLLSFAPAFATLYACLPVDVTGRCLGPTEDRVRVEDLEANNFGNGTIDIIVKLRNVMPRTVHEAYYILQVRDADGRNVYLHWDIREIPDGAADRISKHVNLGNEKYTIKVMVYTGLDEIPEPLLYSPVERPLNLSP